MVEPHTLNQRADAAAGPGGPASGLKAAAATHRPADCWPFLPVQVAVSGRGSEESHVVLGGGDDVIHLSVQDLPGQAEGEASG